jgi:DNA-binding SARP family transcriptional activator/DNA-binding XRE family transcriptional regulator
MRRGEDERARRLGELIRQHRKAAGLTQEDLAGRARVSVGALRDLEQGRTTCPRSGAMRRLASSLCLDESQRRELEFRTGAGTWPGSPVGAARNGAAASTPPGVRLNVLGPLAAWRDGEPVKLGPSRQRAVLGLAAVHHGIALHRGVIIDALWDEHPPASAVSMIQSYVSRLRRALRVGPGAAPGTGYLLEPAGAGYRFRPGAGFDLADFGVAADRARAALAGGDAAAACDGYEQALALWRGEPLADIEILRTHPAVLSLGQRRGTLILDYAHAACTLGEPERVLPLLRGLAAADPFDERVHARLMIVLACAGQQAAALGVYDSLRHRLDAELGVQPGAELRDAHARVLRQEIPAWPHRDATSADGGRAAGGRAAGGSARRLLEPVAEPALAPVAAPAVAVPAVAVPAVVPRQLPAAARHFVGRAAELGALARLRAELGRSEAGPVIAVVGGPAGVGKTALALRWAHKASEAFPDGQLYVNLHGSSPAAPGPASATMAVRGFLGALGVPAVLLPDDAQPQAGLYRSLLAGKRMLVVLDDARDSAQVAPLLPGTPGCMVIITSRWQLTELATGDCAHLLTVDPLSAAEARQMLAQRIGEARVAAEPTAVAELIDLCARLPMALAIAATRAATVPGLPLADLTARLREVACRPDSPDGRDRRTEAIPQPTWPPAADGTPARLLRLPA